MGEIVNKLIKMAESMGETENSWWGGWLQTAKEKSLAAVDFVKKDLTEFTNTMTHDTTKIVEVTSSTIKETLTTENTNVAKDKMKQGISTLFSGISKALTVPHDDHSSKPMHASEGAAIFDRSKVRLHAIQVDPGTYLNKPSGPAGLFQDWVAGFKMDEKKGDISEVLVVNVEVRALYTKLVPSELSHGEFWQRYFYKLHQLEMDEVRKQAMMTRAEREREDSLGWEDDWSGDEDFEELSNTDQTTASDIKQSALECNTTKLSSSVLSPIPERGKEMAPSDESHVQCENDHIQINVSTPCDKLPCGHTDVIQNQQENKQSTSSDQKEEDLVSKTDPEQKLSSDVKQQTMLNDAPTVQIKGSDSTAVQMKESDSTVQMKGSDATAVLVKGSDSTAVQMKESDSTMEEKGSKQMPVETLTSEENSVSAKPVLPLEKASDVVEPDEAISLNTKLSEEQSKENNLTDNINNNFQSPAINLLPPATETSQKITEGIPEKTPELEKSSSIISETPQSALEQRTVGTDLPVPVDSHAVSTSKDEEQACALVGPGIDIKTKIKGDMVLVGSDRGSPNSDSSGTKDPSTEEDWEHDFDLEVTEEDLKVADEIAKHLGTDIDLQDEDWENWE